MAPKKKEDGEKKNKSHCCVKNNKKDDTDKIFLRVCYPQDPPHPCDQLPPCEICEDGESCPKKVLCRERIKNPYKGYETRCQFLPFLPVQICQKPDPHHPCDPPLPCVPGKPKRQGCPKTLLCKEKVKNPVKPWVICPGPDTDESRELCKARDELKKGLPVCPPQPCPTTIRVSPFESAVDDSQSKQVKDPNEYLYSRVLCENIDMLRQKIVECYKPCPRPIMVSPFEKPIQFEDTHPCPNEK